MEIVVWNTQGDKWEAAWNNAAKPLVVKEAADVMMMLLETGWAPWADPAKDVKSYELYSLRALENPPVFGKGSFCDQIVNPVNPVTGRSIRTDRHAFWVPWVNSSAGNPRCCLGAAYYPHTLPVVTPAGHNFQLKRPVISLESRTTKDPKLAVFAVHLTSGNSKKALHELEVVMNKVGGLCAETNSALIVGDMNINLQDANDAAAMTKLIGGSWKLLNIGRQTQRSMGELDFGIYLARSKPEYNGCSVTEVKAFDNGWNQSDHSVLQYSITIP